MPDLKISIAPDGSTVAIDANGFKGQGCKDWETKLAKAIGTVEESGKKPEFYATEGAGLSVGGK